MILETVRGQVEHVHAKVDHIRVRVQVAVNARLEYLLNLVPRLSNNPHADGYFNAVRSARTNAKVGKQFQIALVRIIVEVSVVGSVLLAHFAKHVQRLLFGSELKVGDNHEDDKYCVGDKVGDEFDAWLAEKFADLNSE